MRPKCLFLLSLLGGLLLGFSAGAAPSLPSARPITLKSLGSIAELFAGKYDREFSSDEWLLSMSRDHKLRPLYSLPHAPSPLIFANYGYTWPVLLKKEKGLWQVLRLELKSSDIELWGKEWQFVAVSPDSRQIAAVLDHSIEGSGHELLILYSPDAGESWELRGLLIKRFWMESFKNFFMDAAGKGWMILTMEDDQGKMKKGDYYYRSLDHGKSWKPVKARALPLSKDGFKPLSPLTPATFDAVFSVKEFEALLKEKI